MGPWLQETLKTLTDSELEALTLYSTKTRPKAQLQGGGRIFVI